MLTDRYLTFKYLQNIPYGDNEYIKEKVKVDINNIKKESKFENLISYKIITLKEASDIYKKVKKYDNTIIEFKKKKKLKERDFKLLFSSVNFIFMMNKNQSQFKNNVFKGMQFAFWQLVIEVGRKVCWI